MTTSSRKLDLSNREAEAGFGEAALSEAALSEAALNEAALNEADRPQDSAFAGTRNRHGEITVFVPDNPLRRPISLLGEIASDGWRSRELVWRLFSRNLRGMYRQTVLGVFWVFLPPIAATAVWMFLKSQAGFDIDVGVNYLVYVLTGMVLWQGFADAFQAPLSAVQSNRAMLTKVNLPRETVLYVALSEAAFNMAVRLTILLPVFLINGVSFSFEQLFALAAVPSLMLLAAGIGMMICPFGSLYHDVGRFIRIAIPFWMICTPIIYATPDSMPASLSVWLNPAAGPLIVVRDLLVGLQTNPAVFWLGATLLVASIPVFLIGVLVYRIAMPFAVERM